MLFHFSQVVQQKMGVRGMVMIARHPIWPVCVVLVPPGVWCLLIVTSFVFSAAGGHDSDMAEIELDRGLDNVAHKIILEFGTVVARDLYAGKKKKKPPLRTSYLPQASTGGSLWLTLKCGSHSGVRENPKSYASVLNAISCHLRS